LIGGPPWNRMYSGGLLFLDIIPPNLFRFLGPLRRLLRPPGTHLVWKSWGGQPEKGGGYAGGYEARVCAIFSAFH